MSKFHNFIHLDISTPRFKKLKSEVLLNEDIFFN